MTLFESLLLAIAGPGDAPIFQPAEAVGRAEAKPGRDVGGTFEMKVGAVGRSRNALFLLGGVDQRSPISLIFRLTPLATRQLMQRFGPSPQMALIGRTVRGRGRMRTVPTDILAFSVRYWCGR